MIDTAAGDPVRSINPVPSPFGPSPSRRNVGDLIWATPVLALMLWILPFQSRGAPGSPAVACGVDGWTGKFVTGGFVEGSGWAVDEKARVPVSRMEVRLDWGTKGDVSVRDYRPDVGTALGDPAFAWSAWRATVSLRGVRPGPHQVEVLALSRSGRPIGCASVDFEVRDFPSPESRPFAIWSKTLLRALFFFSWLTIIGWGFLRFIMRATSPLLAPGAGLCLVAVGIDLGSSLHLRPLSSTAGVTVLSVLLLAISARRWRFQARAPSREMLCAVLVAACFSFGAAVPLASHGPGAVLGASVDAPWECSVGDSIARFGWSLPPQVAGYFRAIPAGWRRVHFRGGSPYLLALLAQTFGQRAHEVHSAVGLVLSVSILCSLGALLLRLNPRSSGLLIAGVSLVGLHSVLLSNLYGQHLGLLCAVSLYVFFLFFLIVLGRSGSFHAIPPLALAIAADWALYPEAMALWVLTGFLAAALARTRRTAFRILLGLGLAALTAIVVNPVGLMRSLLFTMRQVRSNVFATPKARLLFGDTHSFPSLGVIPGFEPFYPDGASSSGWLVQPVAAAAAVLLLFVIGAGLRAARRSHRRLLALLLLPTGLTLGVNRWLEFPYGYSKALLHAVPVWAITFFLILTAVQKCGRTTRACALLCLFFVLVLSARGAVRVADRAVRAVPGYDPAYTYIPELTRRVGPQARLLVDEPSPSRFEWIAYFAGENLVFRLDRDLAVIDAVTRRSLYRLVDLRDRVQPLLHPPVASNAFFAIVPASRFEDASGRRGHPSSVPLRIDEQLALGVATGGLMGGESARVGVPEP